MSGCIQQQERPLFAGITSVTIRYNTEEGLQSIPVDDVMLQRFRNCLNAAKRLPADDERQLLQQTYLVQVSDASDKRTRTFELYTDKTFKGNKGKYYSTECLLDSINEAKRRAAQADVGL